MVVEIGSRNTGSVHAAPGAILGAMPTPTVRLGPPARDRDERFLERLLDAQHASGPTSVGVLVPSALARRALVVSLMDRRPGGLFLPRIWTLDGLVREAASAFPATPFGAGARRALLTELLATLAPRSRLRRARDLPGLARALDHFFRALGRQKIWTSDHLESAIGAYRGGDLDAMDADITALYRAYREHLPQRPPPPGGTPVFATSLELTAWVVAAPKTLRAAMGPIARLTVRGFEGLPPLTTDLILAAASAAGETEVIQDDVDAEGALTGDDAPERARAPHRALAARGATVQLDPTTTTDALAELGRALAAGHTDRLPAAPIASGGAPRATLTAYADPLAEVQAIARAVRAELDRGTSPERIAVAFASMERHLPLVRERFPGYGVPFHATTGIPLVSAPPVAVALSVIDAVTSGLTRPRVERLLRARYVDAAAFSAKDPAEMDTLARAARITGGNGEVDVEWLEMIDTFVAGAPSEEAEHRAAIASGYRALFAALAPLTSARRATLTAAAFVERTRAVIGALGIARIATLEADTPELAPSVVRDVRALERFDLLLDELAAACAAAGDPARSLDEWAMRLRAVLADETLDPMEESPHGVPVVSVAELSSLAARTVFVGGLTEDALPRPPVRELFYPPAHDPARDFLHHVDPAREDHAAIAGALARHDRVHLSWPEEIAGAPILPAAFVDRLAGLSDLAPLDTKALPVRASDAIAHDARALATAPDAARDVFAAHVLDPERAPLALAALSGLRAAEHRRSGTPSIYTGFVGGPAYVESTGTRYRPGGGAHVYIPTELDTYARCGFSFFAERILGLPRPDSFEEALAPMERGHLLHDIVHRFLERRVASGDHPMLSTDRFDAHRRELLTIARAIIAKADARRGHLFADAELAALTRGLDPDEPGRVRAGALLGFLHHEIARAEKGWRPLALEWRFGGRHGPPVVMKTPDGDLAVRGRIDRVDLHDDSGAAEVIDYKSGKPPATLETTRGARFQLPIYLAVRRAHQHDVTAWNATYYQLKSRKPGPMNGLYRAPKDTAAVDEMITEMRARLGTLSRAIAAGAFPLTVLDEENAPCGACPYVALCRVEPGRWRARRAALEGTGELTAGVGNHVVYLPDPPVPAGSERTP